MLALHKCCYRFLSRYSYSIRKATHIGQELKENSQTEFKKFFKLLYNVRKKYENECDNTIIYNMDETIFFLR